METQGQGDDEEGKAHTKRGGSGRTRSNGTGTSDGLFKGVRADAGITHVRTASAAKASRGKWFAAVHIYSNAKGIGSVYGNSRRNDRPREAYPPH